MNEKIGIVAVLLGLLVMAMIPAAFADDESGDTPQNRCEGSNYRIDNSGVSGYRLDFLDKIWTHVKRDLRYETVFRAIKNYEMFARTPKGEACGM
ncbi:MAG: hypothetical protein AABY22_26485 [Nanoarchaeota archaeon]